MESLKVQIKTRCLLMWGLTLVCPLLAYPFVFIEIFNRQKYAITILALLLAMSAYLYLPVGDLYRYWLNYEDYKSMEFQDIFTDWNFDYLVYIILYCIAKLDLNHAFLRYISVFISALIYFNIIYNITNKIKDQQINFLLFLLSFFTFPYMTIVTGIRFGVAATFILSSYYYLHSEKKSFKGIIFAILAAITHFGTIPIILIEFLILITPKINKKTIFLTSLIIISANTMLMNYIPFFSDLAIYEKIISYTSGEDYINTVSPLLRLIMRFPQYLIIPFIIYTLLSQKQNNIQKALLCIMIFISFVLPFETPRGRYITIFNLLACLYLIINYTNKEYKIFPIYIILAFALISYVSIFFSNYKVIMHANYYKMLYTPYPSLFYSTYNETWITNNISTQGELIKN